MHYQSTAHRPRAGRLLALLVIALVVLMTMPGTMYDEISKNPVRLALLTGVNPDDLRALINKERAARGEAPIGPAITR
jgi:hypothetical protein